MEQVYTFVKQNIFLKQREFYLYEAPPKRVIKDMSKNLKQMKMVPSGFILFAWSDLEQTTNKDGPFLDIAANQKNIITF